MNRYLESGYRFSVKERTGEFEIKELIGRGASCVVYHAIGSDDTEHLLKEYYPKHLEVVREGSGQIVVPEDKRETFEQGLVRFRTGCERQKSIRLSNEGLKNFTCNVQGYYVANGTEYIDMTCFNGRTYDHVQEKSVYNLMLRMRTLAQVVGNYHKAGLLHLDIKPENVYVRPEGETIEDVMLFDFDSVTPMNEIIVSKALSCTKTWAAPEQILPGKRGNICEATDLFAVGEMIFYQLMGRHSSTEERCSFAKYEFNLDAPIFENINPRVLLMLEDLLHHTICGLARKRYQSADDLIAKLDELISKAKPEEPDTYRYRYETHLHTSESTPGAPQKAKELVKLYSNREYSGIIITDCLKSDNSIASRLKKPITWEQKVSRLLRGYEEAKEAAESWNLDVFLGWEFCVGEARFLTYGLGKDFLLANKNLDRLSIEEYSRLVRENGGYIVQSHPYKDEKVPIYDLSLIDGIEVFNECVIAEENKKAIEFAIKTKMPMQAGTGAPESEQNSLRGIKMEEKATKIDDIIGAIKNGMAKLIVPDEMMLPTEKSAEPIADIWVKIFYDCQHAEVIADKLSTYIQNNMQKKGKAITATYLHMDRFETNDDVGRNTKTILIGHHRIVDSKWEALERMQSKEYQTGYFARYAYDKNLCVLTAARRELENAKEALNDFENAYCKRFKKQQIEVPLRRAQFECIVEEFKETGLEDFLHI